MVCRVWGTYLGCGKLDQVELKPLPTLRIPLGISLYFSIYYPHLYLEITPPDPTLHLIPGTILKGIDAN